jgi:hypothetical protein
MAVAANGSVINGTNGIFKPTPTLSTAESVAKVQKQTRQAHIRNLSRLANLSTQVISGESSSPHKSSEHSISSTVEEILAHGATTTFFGEIFALIQKKELTREELDQKLINWLFKLPALKEKVEGLPDDVRKHVEEFGKWDFSLRERLRVPGFRRPTPAAARKCAGLKAAWKEQYELDGGNGYPSVVENNGDTVMYVENSVFQNWGDTIQNTPAVCLLTMELIPDHIYSEKCYWGTEYCQIRKRRRKESPCLRIQVCISNF